MAPSDPDVPSATSPEKRSEAIARFHSGVAHDLNNRLTTLLGNLMLLEMEGDRADAECLADMRHAAEEATRLVGLIQTFTRRDAYPPHPVNVGETLERFHDLARRLFGDACALDFALPETPVFAEADEGALEHMVLSLLADYPGDTPPAWIHLAISAADDRIDLDFEAASAPWTLSAVAPSVHDLVGAYGGGICEHAPGLRLTLPQTTPEVMDPAPLPEPAHGIALLLAEGNPVLRAHLAKRLTAFGYQVTAAADVRACLDCLDGAAFAAAVVDTRLPGGGASRLNAANRLPNPVVWMSPTREPDPSLASEALLLPKPFAASSLHRLLCETMEIYD